MDAGELIVIICVLIFAFAFFKGFYNLVIKEDYVYDCRYACQQLMKTDGDSFDVQTCFTNCLELMTE